MLYFIRGEPDRVIGPLPVDIIGSLGYAALALLIFFSTRALAPTASPRTIKPEAIQVTH